MKLYRAIPFSTDNVGKDVLEIEGLTTRRIPKNVPYIVDNIWEHLRPNHAPSRRHAAYASPTPELALKNASSRPDGQYEVWEVELPDSATVAICSVPDAREHNDISNVPVIVTEYFSSMPNSAAREEGLLRLKEPVLEGAALFAYFCKFESLEDQLMHSATFWLDTKVVTMGKLKKDSKIAENSEIFFSSLLGYRLRRVPN